MSTVCVLQTSDVGTVYQEGIRVPKFTVYRYNTYFEIFHTSLTLIVISCSIITQMCI